MSTDVRKAEIVHRLVSNMQLIIVAYIQYTVHVHTVGKKHQLITVDIDTNIQVDSYILGVSHLMMLLQY